jgi:hypothetical protein
LLSSTKLKRETRTKLRKKKEKGRKWENQTKKRGRKQKEQRRTLRARTKEDHGGLEKPMTKAFEMIIFKIPKTETPNRNHSLLSKPLVQFIINFLE